MRISGTRVDRALQQRAYPVRRAQEYPAAEPRATQATSAYRVTLSTTAYEVAAARGAVGQPPAARAEKVGAIRAAVESGAYAPSSLDIAQKIMEAIGLVP